MVVPRHLVLGEVALLIIVASIIYWPSMRGGFIFDDDLLLTENSLIKNPGGWYRFWCLTEPIDFTPVANNTLWLEWRLWGMNPTGYHVTNLLLHIASVLLIWVILRRLAIPGAFLAALLFAVHPVNVESVAWIGQRRNVLAMFFALLSVLWYLREEEDRGTREEAVGNVKATLHTGRWYWFSLLAFVLAMLSKGSVASLPVILVGLIVWRRRLSRWDWIRMTPFFVIAAVLTGVNIWCQNRSMNMAIRSANLDQRLAGAGAVVWFYLSKAVLPINLIFVYPQWRIQTDNVLWWLPLLAALLITAGLVWRRNLRRTDWDRPLLFAWGYFCVALVPVLGFADVGFMQYSLVADHYQHIAIIGVITLVAAGWSYWFDYAHGLMRSITIVTAVVAVAILMTLTWQQCRLYVDAMVLYRATLEKNPDCWLAQDNLGSALFDIGQTQEARQHYEQALQLKPDYPLAHNNLGNVLLKTGHMNEAIKHFHQAIQLKPGYFKAHFNLGNALKQSGRLPEAIDQYEQALTLNPNYLKAHNNLGNALKQSGRLPEAIDHYQQALQIKPDYTDAWINLASAYAQMNRPTDALTSAEKALELARAQGQAALTQHIEAWLASYRANPSNSNDKASRPELVPPGP